MKDTEEELAEMKPSLPNKEEYVKTVTRPYAPFYTSLFHCGYMDKPSWDAFLGFSFRSIGVLHIDGVVYYPRWYMEDFPRKITTKLFQDKSYYDRIRKETLVREKALIRAVNQDFERFCKAYSRYVPILGVYFVCDDLIEEKMKRLLLEKLDAQEVGQLMQYLIAPYQDNFSRRSQKSLAASKDVEAYVQEFGWFDSRYGHIRPYPREKAVALLDSLRKYNFLQAYKKSKEEIMNAVTKAKRALDAEDRHIIDVMQFFIYYRTQRTDVMNMVAYAFAPQLERIARGKGLSYEELIHCTYEEIIHSIPSKSTLRKRQKHFSFLQDGSVLTGREHEYLAKTFEERVRHGQQVRGRIAYPGSAKGRARIISSYSDLAKIGKGDVLVTTMTTQEMVPVLEKVAAFVTDEGGITCHAAIIARELKKPCVIGTKTATKAFKDGDLVEVDAVYGVVRKL